MSYEQEKLSIIDFLFEASRTVKSLEVYIRDTCGVEPVASICVNFRDALFHYERICAVSNSGIAPNDFVLEYQKQRHAIQEHLNRSYTDACIYLLMIAGLKLYGLSKIFSMTKSMRAELIKKLHEVRNLSLDIRLSGARIERNVKNDIIHTINTTNTLKIFYQNINCTKNSKRLK